jgi:putative oxidoreductase
MKRSLLSELIVALLILLFVYTATNKFLEFFSFRYVLSTSPLTGKISLVVAWILPIAYAIFLLLFFPFSRFGGLRSFVLLLLLTGCIVYMLALAFHLRYYSEDVTGQLSWKELSLRNIFFTEVALAGIWLSCKPSQPDKRQTAFS